MKRTAVIGGGASGLLAGLAHTPAKATGPTKTATPTLAQ